MAFRLKIVPENTAIDFQKRNKLAALFSSIRLSWHIFASRLKPWD